MNYTKIDPKSRMLLDNWRLIWTHYISDNMVSMSESIKRHANQLSALSGCGFDVEHERVNQLIVSQGHNAKENLNRINWALENARSAR